MRSEPCPNRHQSPRRRSALSHDAPYQAVYGDVSKIIEAARESAARSVNAAMTAAYWLIGRRIVEFEQSGEDRAEYGAALIDRLAEDLTGQFGRGFSSQNVYSMRLFYLSYPPGQILQTLSGKLALPPRRHIFQTMSGKFDPPSAEAGFDDLLTAFRLPWSAYVRLLSVRNESARQFYESEALRGGWSVRQLDRQIGSQFYERTALSKNRAAMLTKGRNPRSKDLVRPAEEIKDPFVLEFLDLKDEYSESDLEEALVGHLETFLLELEVRPPQQGDVPRRRPHGGRRGPPDTARSRDGRHRHEDLRPDGGHRQDRAGQLPGAVHPGQAWDGQAGTGAHRRPPLRIPHRRRRQARGG